MDHNMITNRASLKMMVLPRQEKQLFVYSHLRVEAALLP